MALLTVGHLDAHQAPADYHRISSIPVLHPATGAMVATINFASFVSQAAREAGAAELLTSSISIVQGDDVDLAVGFFAAPTQATMQADLFRKGYAALRLHPDSSALFATATDV